MLKPHTVARRSTRARMALAAPAALLAFVTLVTLVTLVTVVARGASAQAPQDVAACTNGSPRFAQGDDTAAVAAINRLLWRTSFSTYIDVQRRLGSVAAFDTINARGSVLLSAAKAYSDTINRSARAALAERIAAQRGILASNLQPNGVPGRNLVQPVMLKMIGDMDRPGFASLGLDVPLDFNGGGRVVATAICAVAGTMSRYLEYLLEPQLDSIATRYHTAVAHWDLFFKEGYSMTLVERLAASCRLGFIGFIIDPIRRCTAAVSFDLGPPRDGIVFVHPSAGIAPVLRADSTFRSAALAEIYGYIHHDYSDDKVRTWGVSLAWAFVESGPSRPGAIAHTPWGTVGFFGRGGERGVVTVSADVLGWVPGVRSAVSALKDARLNSVLSQLAPLGAK